MGWVTLSLRKRELKQEHQYYQLRDLQISREKRKLARTKAAEMAKIQSEETAALAPIKSAYKSARDEVMGNMSSLFEGTTVPKTKDEYDKKVDEAKDKIINGSSDSSSNDSSKSNDMYYYQMQLQNYSTNYTDQVNAIKDYYDNEKSMLEEEVGDQETQLEMEQVDIETQMEAISEELNAVSEAISSEIKSSTIKLA